MPISPNSSARNHIIDRVTIHCMAGQLTALECANLPNFRNSADPNPASCNWAVGKDGSVEVVVPEERRSWCSSNRANDMRAITFEVASSKDGSYVTPEAYEALIKLLYERCKAHGVKRLMWLNDASKTDAQDPPEGTWYMSVHCWYANKACPGEYLLSRMGEISRVVTEALNRDEPAEYAAHAWKWAKERGITDGSDPHGNITREQAVTMLYRFWKGERNDA